MKIEIYNKKSGEVVETKELENLKGFLFYFAMQCDNKRFAWRTAKEAAA